MSERPTPRTDAIEQKYKLAVEKHGGLVPYGATELARQLERELAESRDDNLEQARLLGMSAEREASLMAQIEQHKQAAELNKQEIEKAIPEPPSPQWIAINLLARQRDQLARACKDARLYLTGEALPTRQQAIKAIDDALAILDAPST